VNRVLVLTLCIACHSTPRSAAQPRSAPRAALPAAPPALAPISPDLPTVSSDSPAFARAPHCDANECRLAVPAVAPTVAGPAAAASTSHPLAATFYRIARGATLIVPLSVVREAVGVVLAGEATISAGSESSLALPWTAFRATGGLVAISTARSAWSLVAVIVVEGSADPSPHAATEITTRALAEVPDLAWAGGGFHARIAFDGTLSRRASLEILMGSANGPVARHQHPGAWEVLMAVSADGSLERYGEPATDGGAPSGPPSVVEPVRDGDVMYVPASAFHAWHPAGTRPLVAIQSYTPPGAEQRFRTLASSPSPSPNPNPR